MAGSSGATVITNSVRQPGFTLVELVSIIAIAGIVLAVSSGRLFGGSAFDQRMAEDSLLSLVRIAQLNALSGNNVSLRFSDSGASITVSHLEGITVKEQRDYPKADLVVGLDITPSDGISNCGSLVGATILSFDTLGEIGTSYSTGLVICLDGQPALCISPSGFSHSGSCV